MVIDNSLTLGFADYEAQSLRLAKALSSPYARIDIHHFPDGESRLVLPPELPDHLIICQSLNQPNSKLIELLLVVETARQLGARQITLVTPYLCYMRQDIAFHPGEVVSQKIIGRFLAELFDAVITVDAHLHRISKLEQAIPDIKAINTSAAPLMSVFLRNQTGEILLVGPDSESAQWVETIAHSAGYESVVANKQRFGDRRVKITLPSRDYTDQKIVLIDDVISTGHTLITIAGMLYEKGAKSVDALVTHALHDETVARQMHEAGVNNIWSTDSVTHPSNILHLDQILAATILQM